METADELARRTRAGDRAVFDALYDSLFPKVYTFVARRIEKRENAEAIVKEIFFDLLATLPAIPAEESVLRRAFTLTRRRLEREAEVTGGTRRGSRPARAPRPPGVGGRAA